MIFSSFDPRPYWESWSLFGTQSDSSTPRQLRTPSRNSRRLTAANGHRGDCGPCPGRPVHALVLDARVRVACATLQGIGTSIFHTLSGLWVRFRAYTLHLVLLGKGRSSGTSFAYRAVDYSLPGRVQAFALLSWSWLIARLNAGPVTGPEDRRRCAYHRRLQRFVRCR